MNILNELMNRLVAWLERRGESTSLIPVLWITGLQTVVGVVVLPVLQPNKQFRFEFILASIRTNRRPNKNRESFIRWCLDQTGGQAIIQIQLNKLNSPEVKSIQDVLQIWLSFHCRIPHHNHVIRHQWYDPNFNSSNWSNKTIIFFYC